MSSPRSTRGRLGGRQASGPNGEIRNQTVSFVVALSEREMALDECEKRGLPLSNAGMRDLFVALLRDQQQVSLAA